MSDFARIKRNATYVNSPLLLLRLLSSQWHSGVSLRRNSWISEPERQHSPPFPAKQPDWTQQERRRLETARERGSKSDRRLETARERGSKSDRVASRPLVNAPGCCGASGIRRAMATRDLTRTYLDCRSRKRAWAQLQHVRSASRASPPERDNRTVLRTVGPNTRGASERSQRPQRFQERARVA